jgi:hypothetical protein
MRPNQSTLILLVALSGCASAELNHNTLDIASNSDNLLTRQTIYNLSNFLDSNVALPAQIVVSSGTATTADTATAGVTTPLNQAITNLAQSAKTISSNSSTVLTGSKSSVTAAVGFSTTAQDVSTQNYSFQMITDPYQLWRLKALYRLAVEGDKYEGTFVKEYPKIYKSVTQQRTACLHDRTKSNSTVYGTGTTTDPASGLPSQFQSCVTQYGTGSNAGTGGATMGGGTDSTSILVLDEHFLTGPTCIVCERRNAGKTTYAANERLKGRWLHWRGLPGATPPGPDTYRDGDIFVGRSGHYELYVDPKHPEKFADFTIFVLAASTQADSAVTGGSGGGAGAGAGGGGGGGNAKGSPALPSLLLTLPTGQ